MQSAKGPRERGTAEGARTAAAVEMPLWRVILLVVMPFAGGYFLSYLYRSVNAVISNRLVDDLGLDASALGLLTAAYFLAFAAFQLPLGLLLDRFGPRRVQACLLLVAAFGALVFSLGQDLLTLTLGRALIGLGVAGGLMASFKAFTLWFPPKRWPLVNGCFLAIGGLGAAAATAPVEAALQFTDWRGVFAVLSGATVLVAASIFLLVPERVGDGKPGSLREQLAGIAVIFRSPLFWALAPLTVAIQAGTMSIQGLWAGPWLRDVGGLDQTATATYLLAMALAMTVGFAFAGALADVMERVGVTLNQLMGSGALLFLLAQSSIVFEWAAASVLPWIALGFTANMVMLAYPRLSRHFPLAYAGRVNTALNLLVFVAAFSAQYAIGGLLDLFAIGGRYTPRAYQLSFGVVLGLQVASYAWFVIALARAGRARPGT